MLTDTTLIRYGEVKRVEDSAGGLRIKVRIKGDDDRFKDSELPYCFPLMPKMIHVNPKVGEMVFVIMQSLESNSRDRFFIGPVISQDNFLNMSSFLNGTTLFNGKQALAPLANPSLDPENKGSIPQRDAISIRSRHNSDLQLIDGEVRLRCGFLKNPFSDDPSLKLKYNSKDTCFLQMKYDASGKIRTERDSYGESEPIKGYVNVIGDRINLLSYKSGDPDTMGIMSEASKVGAKDEMLSMEALERILENAHPLPYGDKLIAFLKQFIDIFRRHTHPFHMEPTRLNEQDVSVLETDLDTMLSKAIRIN